MYKTPTYKIRKSIFLSTCTLGENFAVDFDGNQFPSPLFSITDIEILPAPAANMSEQNNAAFS